MRDILRGLAGDRHTKVEIDVSGDLTDLVIDPAKFKQVLYNYLSNAIKFTPEGGHVAVRVVPEGRDRVRVDVEDTGIGVRRRTCIASSSSSSSSTRERPRSTPAPGLAWR